MIAEWISGITIFGFVSLEILGFSYLFSKLKLKLRNKSLTLLFSLLFINLFSLILSQVNLSVRNNALAHFFLMAVGCLCFFFLKTDTKFKIRNPKFFSPLFWKKNIFWLLPIFLWFLLKGIDFLIPHFQNLELERILSHSKNTLLYRNDPIIVSLDEKFAKLPFFEMIFVHILSVAHVFGTTFLKVHFRGLIAIQLFYFFWGLGLSIHAVIKAFRLNMHYSALYCLIWFVCTFFPERWWLYSLIFLIFTLATEFIPDLSLFFHEFQKRANHLKIEYKIILVIVLLFSTQPHAHVIWQHLQYAKTPLQSFLVSRQESFQAVEWLNQNFTTDDQVISSFKSAENSYYSKPYLLYAGDSAVLAENLDDLEFPSEKRDVLCDFEFTHFLSEEQHTEESLTGLTIWLMTKKDTKLWKNREYSLFNLLCEDEQPAKTE